MAMMTPGLLHSRPWPWLSYLSNRVDIAPGNVMKIAMNWNIDAPILACFGLCAREIENSMSLMYPDHPPFHWLSHFLILISRHLIVGSCDKPDLVYGNNSLVVSLRDHLQGSLEDVGPQNCGYSHQESYYVPWPPWPSSVSSGSVLHRQCPWLGDLVYIWPGWRPARWWEETRAPEQGHAKVLTLIHSRSYKIW